MAHAWTRRRSVAVLGVGLVAMTLMILLPLRADKAVAAPTWLAPIDVSAAGLSAYQAQIAINASGDAIAIWQRPDPSYHVVQASERPAGGTWAPPVRLSDAARSAYGPHVAIDAQGNAVAVWQEQEPTGRYVIEGTTRAASGGWSAAEELSDPSRDVSEAQVAIGPDGEAIAIWRYAGGLVQARTHPAGGAWSAAEDLSEPDVSGADPQVTISATGEVLVVWSGRRGPSYKWVVQVAVRAAGTSEWKAPIDLYSSTVRFVATPQVAEAPSGEAAVVWTRQDPMGPSVLARVRPAGASAWGKAFVLSGQDEELTRSPMQCQGGFEPQVAAGPSGETTAVWTCDQYDEVAHYLVQARTHSPGALSWSAKTDLSDPGPPTGHPSPEVAVGGNGEALAIWGQGNDFANVIQVRTHPVGGEWTATEDLTPADAFADGPQVAADDSGNAIAAWVRWNGSEFIAQAAGYDAAGPQLRELEIPATGTVGETLAFSVTPVDVWSAVQSVEWDFGDGRTAAGESVSHAYRRPGTYEVRVTATDVLGNSTQATGTVRVRWPATPVGPLREAQERPLP